jgi:hypothetical protein
VQFFFNSFSFPEGKTLAGHIAPKTFPMTEFYKIPAINSIRTNPTFPPLKFTIPPQNRDWK